MDVVAEGVEAEDDAVDLLGLGCEYAQGFLYGHPMAAADASALLFRAAPEAKAAARGVEVEA
jgi:EAL domain-containing protein (putative c-di-GMP-specific phosphodiesterase class I)